MSNFLKVARTCKSKEQWNEMFELESVEAIEENRINNNNYPYGYRRGYNVILKSGYKFWINDNEYAKLIAMLNICNLS